MLTRLKQLDWSDWFYTLIKAFIGGGANAVIVTFAAGIIKPDAFNLGVQLKSFLALVIVAFIINGVLNTAYILSKSPLPSMIEVPTTTVQSITTSVTSTPTTTEVPSVKKEN